MAPGMGDGIQAAKAGILEIGDLYVVNKADRDGADQVRRDLRSMLALAERPEGAWRPPIVKTIASKAEGLDEVVAEIDKHRDWLASSGRARQAPHPPRPRRDRGDRRHRAPRALGRRARPLRARRPRRRRRRPATPTPTPPPTTCSRRTPTDARLLPYPGCGSSVSFPVPAPTSATRAGAAAERTRRTSVIVGSGSNQCHASATNTASSAPSSTGWVARTRVECGCGTLAMCRRGVACPSALALLFRLYSSESLARARSHDSMAGPPMWG